MSKTHACGFRRAGCIHIRIKCLYLGVSLSIVLLTPSAI